MSTLPNPRRERFCQLVALGKNPHQARIEAGFTSDHQTALMRHPQVIKRINEIKAAAARKTVMDLAEMEERLSQIARSDLAEFITIEEDGSMTIDFQGKNTAALAGIDVTDWRGGREGRATSRTRKLKIRDPIAAMDLLAKLQRFYEIPPSLQDNRQYNIIVADAESKVAINRILSGESRKPIQEAE